MATHEPQLGTVLELASRMRLLRPENGLASITFLIGAGCSVSAGIPSVKTIAQTEVVKLAQKLTGKSIKEPSKALIEIGKAGYIKGHLEIAQSTPDALDWGQIYDTLFAEVYSSPSEVSRLFKATIKDAKPKINWAHLALGEFARLNWISTTITTNFDLLALEGYARAGVIPVVSDGIESLDRIDPKPDQAQLLQINGSVHSYRLRNSPADLEQVSSSSAAITCFRSLYQASDLMVIVGYDGREPQIMGLLTEAAKTFKDKHVFWCLHSQNPASLSDRAADFLSHSANARLIPGQDADLFFFELSQRLGIDAPLAFRDPLEFLVERNRAIYAPDEENHSPIRKEIENYFKEMERLKDCGKLTSHLATPPVKAKRRPPKRTNDPKAFANQLVEDLISTIGADNEDKFGSLRKLQDEWYIKGRDGGRAFDAAVAIHLAEHSLEFANGPDQRGSALDDLGMALQILGEREQSTARLEAAVVAHSKAMIERSRDRTPINWATSQFNLGSALLSLGIRESNSARLEAGIAAYSEALKEFTRDRLPRDWAMAQMNLGNALAALAERENGTMRLEAAIAAYTEALNEFSRDQFPMEWAAVQMNLGSAFAKLGQRVQVANWLESAIIAYNEALKEFTRDRRPLDWAKTQMQLGIAHENLGAQRRDLVQLDAALMAYSEATLEFERGHQPLYWAALQVNIAKAHMAYFDIDGDRTHLVSARAILMPALKIFVDAGADHYIKLANDNLVAITRREAR